MDTRIDPAKVTRLLGDWRSPALPDYKALARALGDLIDGARLSAARILPSQRSLATVLGVARGTVVRAYRILDESGRLIPKRGSGHYVTRTESACTNNDGDFLSFADHPPEIDLSSSALPGDDVVVEAMGSAASMLTPERLACAGYAPSGIAELRDLVAQKYTNAGFPTSSKEILITAGAQQAVWLVAHALTGPGTLTTVEDPTYPEALDAFRGAGSRVHGIPLTRGRLDLEALSSSISRAAVLYVQTPIHNPTGCHYSGSLRRQIGEIVEGHPAVVVDDHSQADLPWFRSSPLPGLESHVDPGRLLTIGTLSKLFWGGLRIGWVRGPSSLIRQLSSLKSTVDMGAAIPDQLASLLLLPRSQEQLLKRKADLFSGYCAAAKILRETFPTWAWDQPAGGTGLWIDTSVDAAALARVAARIGIRIAPGRMFSQTDGCTRCLRLSVWHDAETMRRALTALRREQGKGKRR